MEKKNHSATDNQICSLKGTMGEIKDNGIPDVVCG